MIGPGYPKDHNVYQDDSDASGTIRPAFAAVIARAVGAKVHVLCVLEAIMYTPKAMRELAERDPETHPEATRRLAEALRLLHELGVQDAEGELEFGVGVDVVLERTRSARYDLLVLAKRPEGHFSALVLEKSRIPVLAVPG